MAWLVAKLHVKVESLRKADEPTFNLEPSPPAYRNPRRCGAWASRPFVYRLATDLALTGWVINDTQGVFIEVEGPVAALQCFLERLPAEVPPRAIVQSIKSAWRRSAERSKSATATTPARTVLVLPDIATCSGAWLGCDPADGGRTIPSLIARIAAPIHHHRGVA
jgi:acylphosphatase